MVSLPPPLPQPCWFSCEPSGDKLSLPPLIYIPTFYFLCLFLLILFIFCASFSSFLCLFVLQSLNFSVSSCFSLLVFLSLRASISSFLCLFVLQSHNFSVSPRFNLFNALSLCTSFSLLICLFVFQSLSFSSPRASISKFLCLFVLQSLPILVSSSSSPFFPRICLFGYSPSLPFFRSVFLLFFPHSRLLCLNLKCSSRLKKRLKVMWGSIHKHNVGRTSCCTISF